VINHHKSFNEIFVLILFCRTVWNNHGNLPYILLSYASLPSLLGVKSNHIQSIVNAERFLFSGVRIEAFAVVAWQHFRSFPGS
jgi:hypothetical protein